MKNDKKLISSLDVLERRSELKKNLELENKKSRKIPKTNSKSESKRTTYMKLTKGGKSFVELNAKNFGRLVEREQQAIAKTAKYTGEDIRLFTKGDWEKLSETPEIAKKTYKRFADIASGNVYAEVTDIAISNYADGLRKAGYISLADRFELYAKDLKSRDQDAFDLFMETEMPDLYLFYKDKGKSHVKRQRAFNQETADEQIEDISLLLAEKYKELPDSDRERLEQELYSEEYEDSTKG